MVTVPVEQNRVGGGRVPAQTPWALHVSCRVQAFPSLHEVPGVQAMTADVVVDGALGVPCRGRAGGRDDPAVAARLGPPAAAVRAATVTAANTATSARLAMDRIIEWLPWVTAFGWY